MSGGGGRDQRHGSERFGGVPEGKDGGQSSQDPPVQVHIDAPSHVWP